MEAVPLNYKVFGRGAPLVILHGLFGSLDNWQTIARDLANDFQVYIADLRNHGRSPHDKHFTYHHMLQDLLFFFDQHKLDKASLVGHSLGGKVAMHFALRHRQLVDQLVVIDISPKRYAPAHLVLFDALLSLDPRAIASRAEAENFLNKRGLLQRDVRFLMKSLGRTSDGFFWKINLPVLFENYHHILSEVTSPSPFEGPVLFLRGEHSSYIADEDLLLILDLFPKAIVDTIMDAGHWLHVDAPDEFVMSIRKFLKDT